MCKVVAMQPCAPILDNSIVDWTDGETVDGFDKD